MIQGCDSDRVNLEYGIWCISDYLVRCIPIAGNMETEYLKSSYRNNRLKFLAVFYLHNGIKKKKKMRSIGQQTFYFILRDGDESECFISHHLSNIPIGFTFDVCFCFWVFISVERRYLGFYRNISVFMYFS